MAKVKISELPALTPATLDTTYVVGISGSTTYKISINQLTSSLDTTFATDLVTAALSSSLNGKLSTSSYTTDSSSFDNRIKNSQPIGYLTTASYTTDSSSFNSRIISGSSVAGTISGSAQISALGFITASTPTNLSSLNTISASYLSFTQSYYSASASFDSRIISGSAVAGTISGSSQISALGFVTGAYTTLNSFNNLTQSFNSISQSFTTISGSFGSIDFSGINSITASYLTFTQSYYSASASFDSRVDGLENATSSYLTSLNGAISSSAQVLNGSGIYSSSAQLPTGLVSGSSQILGGSGIWSGSAQLPTGVISGSVQVDVRNTTGITTIATTGSNQFNGNQYITGAVITTSNIQAGGYVQTSLLYNGGAIEIRSNYLPLQLNSNGATTIINDNTQISGSLRVSGSIFSNGFGLISGSSQILGGSGIWSGSAQLPSGVISGSSQLPTGLVSASSQLLNGSGIYSSSAQLPNGLLSSSLGFVSTASYSTDSSSFNSRIISGSAVAGTISGSSQIAALGYATTSSVTTISASAWGAFQSASSYSGSFYTTINTNIGNITTNSASAAGAFASASSYSSSVSTSLSLVSSSLQSSISSSNYNITINSASVSSISSSFATSTSASNASITALSSSNATTDNTQTTNITAASASAWGAFQSASSYSGSFYTTINTNIGNITQASASAWGAFQSASSYSSSLATSISSSNYNITVNSASVSSLSSSFNTRINSNSASAWGAFQTASANSSSLASSITSVSGTFSDLTLNGSRINANGIITKSYLFAQNNADQSGVGNGTAVIFQTTNASNGSLITKGSNTQVTLTAGNTYKMEAIIRRFQSSNTWGTFRWYDVTNSAYVGVEAFGEMVTSATGVASTGIATHYVTPSVNTTYELRQTTANTISVSSAYASIEIEQINSSFALNTISGGINYTQVLGNRRTGINSVGTSIISGSITTTGKPVQIMVTGDANPVGGTSFGRLQIYRDSNSIGNIIQVENSSNLNVPYCLNIIDTPSAGTYVYSMRLVDTMSGTFDFGEASGPLLIATELGSLTIITDTNNSFTGTNVFSGSTTLRGAVNVGTGSGFEGGEIDFAYAQGGSTTLTGSAVVFDVYADKMRLFENSGTNRGVYVDLSKAPGGVGGELMWKASGIVNAGTDVTLGNLKVRMSTSGNRSLQVSTVTGTYSVYGSSVFITNGTGGTSITDNAPLTITTTPTYINASYSFALGGYTDTWLLMSTANTIAWRINLIVGSGYNNNMISIERLY